MFPGNMVRSVVLARIHDGLPLAASMDDEQVNLISVLKLNIMFSWIKIFLIIGIN